MSDNILPNKYPKIASEWNYTKNGDLKPKNFTCGSKCKIWWICEKNKHEWETMIVHRTNGSGCPFCLNENKGKTLQELFPIVANEWHPYKNGDLKPENFTYGSTNKVWWICEKKHEWEAAISNRTGKNKSECPFCKFIKNGNSLEEKYPDIAKQWHYELNVPLKPNEISFGSNTVVWWICEEKHEWQQTVGERVRTTIGCRTCYTKENSLAVKYPEIAKQWDYNKNQVTPFEIFCHSNTKIFWICENKHSYCTWTSHKIKKPDCPYCIGQFVSNTNNLGILYPELIKYWDYTQNDFTPFDVMPGSNKLITWECDKGHIWKKKVLNVIRSKNNECPECYMEENNLEKLYPHIASEWDYEKNGDLTPSNITYASAIYAWWKCIKKHEWKVQISSRTAFNSSCSHCNTTGYSKLGIEWLNNIATENNICIQHAINGGEYKIKIDDKTFKFDGFCKETNTVYEFLGCLWHFHPPSICKYNKNKKFTDKNPVNKKYNIDLYMNTIERLGLIKNAGYNLVFIWECEYLKNRVLI
jgi:G:T-mismatch repair DNA endonuclease (very short patch repair protein)